MSNQVTFTSLAGGPSAPSEAALFLRNVLPNSMRGRVWDCLIAGLAVGEQSAWDNAPLVRDQLFLSTASGGWLDRRMAGVGLERPRGVGMTDTLARQYAIQVVNRQETTPAVMECLETFYGADAVHAHLIPSLDQPYALVDGISLTVTVDNLDTAVVAFSAADFFNIGTATAQEVAAVMNREFAMRGINAYALVSVNPNTAASRFVVYSGTYGGRSALQVASGTAATLLGLSTSLVRLLSQPRASYTLSRGPESVEVFLPSTTLAVARDDLTAAYLSADYGVDPSAYYGYGTYGGSYVYGGLPATPSVGVGPYLYEGVGKGLGITSTATTVTSAILGGHSYRVVPVASAASFPDATGWVVFGYGHGYQVGPVPYLGKSGTSSLVLDPSFIFASDVPAGATVNLLSSNKAPQPSSSDTGDFWLTDSPSGRVAAGAAVESISAAGYQVTQTVTYPGDIGLGNAGKPTHGADAITDIVACFAGSDVDAETAAARGA